MDQGTGDSAQGQSAPGTDDFAVMPSGQERVSSQSMDESKEDYVTSSDEFVIKLEPPWSMKEEPPDQPSAVYSTVQPMSDNTSGSLLSLNTSHVCQHCSTTFVLVSSLELHMATFHGETWHDLFPMNSAYDCYGVGYHHVRQAESVGNCNSRKAVRGRKEKLEDNDFDRTGQEKQFKKYACDVCSMDFTHAGRFKEHMSVHANLRPFVCDVCGKAFTRTSRLNRHMLIHTGQRPFVCDVCSKAFTQNSTLKQHKMIHMDHKPFVCNVCSKDFVQACQLKTHMLIHSGLKPFVCDVCSKAFTGASGLNRHKLIHTDLKPFVCPVCSKAFTRACYLKGHKVIHTGHKPFVCGVCSKAFTRASHLKDHELVHTGHKPFVCEVCNEAFSRAHGLKRHRLVHMGQNSSACDRGENLSLSPL